MDTRIARVTNIADFDFEHSFEGLPIFVAAGRSKVLPYVAADHWSKHLARQMLLRNQTQEVLKKDLAMWDEGAETLLKSKIMSGVDNVDIEPEMTPQQKLAHEIETMNNDQPDERVTGEPYQTKADVIAELESLNIPYDARMSKANLEKQLAESRDAKTPNRLPEEPASQTN